MHIPRVYENFDNFVKPNKVLTLFGPRQVGKTTLLKSYLQNSKLKYRFETGENIVVREILDSQNLKNIQEFCEGYDLIAIDEAHKIPNIGLGLKMLVDYVPGIRVIVTGSSSFDILNKVGEPLTGRKTVLHLYPVSQMELRMMHNSFDLKQMKEDFLIYGSYPEVVSLDNRNDKIMILKEIAESYLLRDILQLDNVKNSKILLDLLRLLAYQIGKEVSINEIATQLGYDRKTINRYLDLLEKSFVLINIRGYNKNLRKEISKKSKFYFYDIGIRNALISNFNKMALRDDIGLLWENFIFMERLKYRTYKNISANMYFWRTFDGKEIDLIEERDGHLYAYEIKYKDDKIKIPSDWKKSYQNSSYEVINSENYLGYIGI